MVFIHPWFIAQKWGLQEEIFEEFQTVLPESLTGYGTTAPSSGAKRTAGAGLLQKEGQSADVKIKETFDLPRIKAKKLQAQNNLVV